MGQDKYRNSLQRLLRVLSSPRLGLERMERLLDGLGNPHVGLDVFHIAGTNGKGSTAAFLSSLLMAKGFKVGLTTSPHLRTARERIQINGILISEEKFVVLEDRVFNAAQKMADPPTFFERMVAMAFCSFRDENIDYAVVEVGLGGRLDATNVVVPKAAIVTPISLDHQQFLGDDIASIAAEKAGIIKERILTVIGAQEPKAQAVIQAKAKKKNAPIFILNKDFALQKVSSHLVDVVGNGFSFPIENLRMRGAHQLENCAVALATLHYSGLEFSSTELKSGLQSAFWPGRAEVLDTDPLFLLDGAHNPDGVKCLTKILGGELDFSKAPWLLLVGFSQGHDPEIWASSWPKEIQPKEVWVIPPNMPRALSAEATLKGLKKVWPTVKSMPNLPDAMEQARFVMKDQGAICLAGSLYLVGEARAHWFGEILDPQFPLF